MTMGMRPVVGSEYGDGPAHVVLLYCSTTGYPLPLPAFGSLDECEAFVEHAGRLFGNEDLRGFPADELNAAHTEWIESLNAIDDEWPEWNEARWELHRHEAAAEGGDNE